MAKIEGGASELVEVTTDESLVGTRYVTPVYGFPNAERGIVQGSGPSLVYVVSDAQIASGKYKLMGGAAESVTDIATGKVGSGGGAIPVYLVGGALAGAGGAVQYGDEQTLTLQPDATAGADAYIQNSAATTNYGTNATLYIGEWSGAAFVNRTAIKFDLSAIPVNALITSAMLSLENRNTNGVAVDDVSNIMAYQLKRDWVEGEITWNIYSTGNNWQTAGGFGANDCYQTSVGTAEVTKADASGTRVEIPLDVAAVQDWVSGAISNYGLLLKMDTELDNDHAYFSSDDPGAAKRPIMQVKYKVPF